MPTSVTLPYRQFYKISVTMTRKTAFAKKTFEGDKFVINSERKYDELEKLCNEYIYTKITNYPRPNQIERVQKFQERMVDLLAKKASSYEYQMPSLELLPDVGVMDEIWSNHSDDFDSLMVRLRPFILNDLKFNTLCNDITSIRRNDCGDALKNSLMKHWSLSLASENFNACFIKKNSFTAMSYDLSGEGDGFRGKARFIFPYLKLDYKGPLHERNIRSVIEKFYKLSVRSAEVDGFNITRIVDDGFYYDWFRKYEWHAEGDSTYFNTFMDTFWARNIVRSILFNATRDKIVALDALHQVLLAGFKTGAD